MSNNFVLSGRLITNPEQRFTTSSDRSEQLSIAEAMLEFLDGEDPQKLKLIAWNGTSEKLLAFQAGDVVICQGSLGMRTVEREDSTREKVAEMTIYSVQSLTACSEDSDTLVEAQVPASAGKAKAAKARAK
jgi:single-stranded DNA-binding protein